jgi:hypothetical protein
MNSREFERRASRFWQSDYGPFTITDHFGLNELVRKNPGAAAEFARGEIEGCTEFRNLEKAAYIGLMLRGEFGDETIWLTVAKACRQLKTVHQKIIAEINIIGDSDFYIEAPERGAAKDMWLCDQREFAYCDSCRSPKLIQRGDGFLVSDGADLICEECFRASGGVPSRCVRQDEHPDSK